MMMGLDDPATLGVKERDHTLARKALRRAVKLAHNGMVQRPRLASKAPGWWHMPKEAKESAFKFDQHHRRHTRAAKNSLDAYDQGNPNCDRKRRAFSRSLNDVHYDRYFIPELPDELPDFTKDTNQKRTLVQVQTWSVWNDNTIWKPRKAWAEAKDYVDNDDLLRKALECDWNKCLGDHKTLHVIKKSDDSEADPETLADACFEVLWEFRFLIFGAFDFYATYGASDNIFNMQLNAYKLVVERCHLFEAGSKTLNLTAFDQLFIQLNAGHKGDTANALDRQRWLQALIRFSIMRHVTPGTFDSVPRALRHLLAEEMKPNVDPRCLEDTHAFRYEYCYIQDVEEILKYFEGTLRSLFKVYAKGEGLIGDELDSTKLLSFSEWKEMVKDLQLYETDFTAREVNLTFVWSRMRVVDENNLDSKVKLIQLSFEDFLEAIVRCAVLKAMPDDEQIYDYDCEDAGEFIIRIRSEDPQEYQRFIEGMQPVFGEPPAQPIMKLVEHLCHYLCRTIASVIASSGDARKAKSVKEFNNMTPDNIRMFKKVARSSNRK